MLESWGHTSESWANRQRDEEARKNKKIRGASFSVDAVKQRSSGKKQKTKKMEGMKSLIK